MAKFSFLFFPGFMATASVPCAALISYVAKDLGATTKPKRKPRQIKKYECHKWIFERRVGELLVCSTATDSSSSFYLWWFKDYDHEKNLGIGHYIYSVESISTSGDKITFTFKNDPDKTKSKNKVLTIDKWNKEWQNRHREKNIEKLNGRTLEGNCKMTGDDLSCYSGEYETKNLIKQTFHW